MHFKLKIVILSVFCLVILSRTFSQSDTSQTQFNSKRFMIVSNSVGLSYTLSIVGLGNIWYSGQENSKFHFFNDNSQWAQLDKFGHGYTAFHESYYSIKLLKWCGVQHKKAVLYGGLGGFIFQLPIEFFDGFSPKYGASYGDLIANGVGALSSTLQMYYWDDLRIQLKYSYHESGYASQRPKVLGSSLNEKLLKDYNAQIYWACVNLKSFMPNTKIPSWLNLGIGYGANKMIYGSPSENVANGFEMYRQFYLAPDITFRNIKTRSKFLKTIFLLLDVYHLPMPALEVDSRGLVYFVLR